MKKIVVYSGILVLLDQIIKFLITHFIALGDTISIIPGLFHLTYVKNIGAAWSILEGRGVLLILITLIAIAAIYLVFLKDKNFTAKETLLYSLLMGGIMGNLLDRIFRGYVIDYLDFTLGSYQYPIFNIADTCIVIAAICIIIQLIGEEKNEKNRSKRK